MASSSAWCVLCLLCLPWTFETQQRVKKARKFMTKLQAHADDLRKAGEGEGVVVLGVLCVVGC